MLGIIVVLFPFNPILFKRGAVKFFEAHGMANVLCYFFLNHMQIIGWS